MDPFIKKVLIIAGSAILVFSLFIAGINLFTGSGQAKKNMGDKAETNGTSDSNVIEGDIFTKKENLDFDDLKVNVAAGELNYNSGDNEKNGYDIYWNENTFKEKITIDARKEDNQLIIETNPKDVIKIKTQNEDSKDENRVSIFKDGQSLNDADITLGVGLLNSTNLKTKDLKLKIGVGEIKINGLEVKDEAKLETGVGAVAIQNANIRDLELKAGVGDVTIEGVLTGETVLETGIGQVTLRIHGDINDYRFTLDKNISTLTINGEPYENLTLSNNGPHVIEIDDGVGKVNVEFIN